MNGGANGQAFLFTPTSLSEAGVALGQTKREQESLLYLWASLQRYPEVVGCTSAHITLSPHHTQP